MKVQPYNNTTFTTVIDICKWCSAFFTFTFYHIFHSQCMCKFFFLFSSASKTLGCFLFSFNFNDLNMFYEKRSYYSYILLCYMRQLNGNGVQRDLKYTMLNKNAFWHLSQTRLSLCQVVRINALSHQKTEYLHPSGIILYSIYIFFIVFIAEYFVHCHLPSLVNILSFFHLRFIILP